MVAKKITRTLLTVLVICLLLCGTAAGFYFGLSYVLSQSARFEALEQQSKEAEADGDKMINASTPGAIEVYVPRSSDTSDIAELLKDKGLIENVFLFNILSKFNGFDSAYVAGTHYVLPDMSYDEIMFLLSQNPESVTITFQEGLTYKQVKALLKVKGVNFDEAIMDSMVNNPVNFLDYEFITKIDIKEGRDWLLQGYLYPDTYEFDVNTDEETILRTFLNNTERKLADEYFERAEKQGYTMDEIITLASIIQIEAGNTLEMCDISSVFYNRLSRDKYLESCATVNYLRVEMGMDPVLYPTPEDYTFDDPYNTYNYGDLPPGPICSPGDDAIRAALWPSNTNYLYFCYDGDNGSLFASSLAQHDRNIIAGQKAYAARQE